MNEAVVKLLELLSSIDKSIIERVNSYSAFVSCLFRDSEDLSRYLSEIVLQDENIYVLKRASNERIGDFLTECLVNELKIIESISLLSAKEIKAHIGYESYLPEWKISPIDFLSCYMDRMEKIQTLGFGIYSKYHAFCIKNNSIVPVKSPDRVSLAELKGYETQRKTIIDNTLALLKGKPAANVLLYGDAGTGKSSTVKAVVNEFKDRGLRLVEVTKKQFGYLPDLVDSIGKNPLKFILFIDDLSFAEENDDFYALKAVLEGSVSAKTNNMVVYATGNRRHLIKETFSDRDEDDVHRNETIQELVSLSARFGLTVGFFRPGKKLYLDIVRKLKEQYKLNINDDELEIQAERFAISGRSPRTARQLIEYLKSIEQ